MKSIKVKTPAKINLLLNIVGRRLDGYHEIETVFHSINIYDTLILDVIKSENNEIKIKSTSNNIPKDSSNIVYKACNLFLQETKLKAKIKAEISKNIPVEAGLGGGSSNAAGTLIALNKIFEYPLKTDELIKIASKIGADVPFFIQGGTAIGKGIGEQLSPLSSPKMHFVIVSPRYIKISSKWAYEEYDKILPKPIPKKLSSFVEAIEKNDIKTLSSILFNSFEYVVYEKYPELNNIKKRLLELGSLGVLLSGSGSSIYGIIGSLDQANTIKNLVENEDLQVYTASSVLSV